MIVVRLTGGLGNQLFQYAAGRRLAVLSGAELVLEDSFYITPPNGSTHRSYELDKFPVVARRSSPDERLALRTYSGRFWKRFRRCLPLPGPLSYVHEQPGKIKELAALTDNVFLDGYWQSERYFAEIREQLKLEMTPIHPMSAMDLSLAEEIRKKNAVSVHVRRGDYVSDSTAHARHGLCSLEYYKRAIQYLAGRIENPVFFIFSDEPDWVAENLPLTYPHFIVSHNKQSTAFQDLRLMSLCKHHVLANSSFSWWGAWLNFYQDKIVVHPNQWFSGIPNSASGICPTTWISL